MKKKLVVFIGTLLGILASCSKDSSMSHEGLQTQMASSGSKSGEVILAMHNAMVDSSFVSGIDFDIAFLENMVPHHKGAIESSMLMLSYSQDDIIKNIANRIIEVQEKEIKEFDELVATLKKESKSYDEKKASEYDVKAKADMDIIMQNMMNVKLIDNIDKDYLSSMIEHHKGAVSASKIVLEYTSDERIKEIANNIIADQEKEIKEFQDILVKTK